MDSSTIQQTTTLTTTVVTTSITHTTTNSETTSTTSTTTTSETTSTTPTTTTTETTSTASTSTTSETTSTVTTTTTSETTLTTSTTTTSETTSTVTTTTTSEITSTTSTSTSSETTSTVTTTTTSETTSTTSTTTISETTSTVSTSTTSETTSSTSASSTSTSTSTTSIRIRTTKKSTTRIKSVTTSTPPICFDPCQNGGTCISSGVCLCKSGYTGNRCQTSSGGCYYGEDRVNLVDGGQRLIKELKVGDEIWSINNLKDEIILMMHKDPNKSVVFYTFKSVDGNELSLTSSHILPVFNSDENQLKFVRASQVTMKDRLIISNKSIQIRNISIDIRQGYYNPLTLSGYLIVNNISTSVFSDNYKVSSNTIQFVFIPIRIYYRLSRWIFGNSYNPFGDINEGVHPIAQFYKEHQMKLRFLIQFPKYLFSTIFILLLINLIEKQLIQKNKFSLKIK